jgi:chitodextrinase
MSGKHFAVSSQRPIFFPNRTKYFNIPPYQLLILAWSSIAILLCFIVEIITPNAFAAQVTLAWDSNTESDLAGYRIHYGTANGSYSFHTDVRNVTTYTVTGLAEGQTYYFAATAYDTSGNESGYSNQVSYSVSTAANGAPSAPATPSGPASALVNVAAAFSTSATDPNGNSIEYRYDWGGGVISNWGAASQSHSWAAAGSYAVKAQARDSLGAESPWSGSKTISIGYATAASNAAPARPSTPSGPASALVNVAAAFSTSARDPNGNSVEYRYDWGGGVISNWGTASQSHSWAAAGPYSVRAQARDSLGAESPWSRAKTVTIQAASSGQVQSPDADGDGVPDVQDAFPNDPKEWADANGNGIGDNAEATAGPTRLPPNAPLLTSPVNDSVVSSMVILQTGPFNSPAATPHVQTRWQVFRDEDDACLLDIQSTAALTRFTVPKLVLDEGAPFFWRAQFIDANGAASAWSDYEYFSTQKTETDLNGNGIPDAQEVAPTADLDKDGVPDSNQTAIKSVKMEGTTAQTGISIKGTPTATGIESVESEDPRPSDLYANNKPASMPFGILNIKIAVAKPGDPAVVKLYFQEPAPAAGKWYEYDTASEKWIDFSAYTEFAADRLSASITLRDGGAGDADGVANGIIIDPGGIGLADNGPTNGGASQSGSGGGAGCFIGTADAPGRNATMLILLCLLGFLSLLGLRKPNSQTAPRTPPTPSIQRRKLV